MKRRSIRNDPIAPTARERGVVVPIRILGNAVSPAPSPADGVADSGDLPLCPGIS